MSGSASVAHRRHVGLQQLEAISASTHTFLGPNKHLKLIRDEAAGASVLVSTCPRLLQRLELNCSVGQLLHETVQAQQKLFHSGTGALVFLAGVWSGVALECLNRGISVSDIKTAMSKALEVSLQVCKQSAVSVREVSCRRLKEHKPSPALKPDTEPVQCMDVDLRRTLKHSRHFSSAQTENTKTAVNDMTSIAEAVSHGCKTSMHLVLKACKLQSTEDAENSVLDVQKLVTCSIPGPSEERSCVLHGYVTLLSVQQASVVQSLQGQRLNIALVSGDLCETYRHVGFNRPANITHITDCVASVSLGERWVENALRILHEFGVGVVLVHGAADEKLKDRCSSVLVIEGVKSAVLKDFSSSTGAVPVSYITQLDERCVGRGVTVSRCEEHESVRIVSKNTSLVTAVITSSVPAKLQILEDEFWSCAHRLHQALKDGKLLHGSGVTEILCIHKLHQCQRTETENLVLELMAEAWMDYVSTLMLNSGSVASKAEAWTAIAHQRRRYEDGEPVLGDLSGVGVYDNMTVKSEAWRRALDLVLLVLQSDTEIITGGREGEDLYNELMYL
ncbi:Bardet-Biedl syndrome 12 protein [Rhinichthys klamathensis goyatoka]|uniref:Bardet-Biedl syndrome 12 protein n=1 Tax=Rhinichthys klamathensis goyatoka TaxID=3034132 RepID=UPI0024B4E7E1|nr:Bardet-Biedl syndrome 12 protein [Rhinichthys klamathensis goyatoka]